MYGDGRFFEQIVEHLTEIIWVLDADMETVLYVNPAYERLVGPEEALSPLDVIHPENREEASEWLEEIRADVEAGTLEEEYPLEVSVTAADGSTRYLETEGVPVYTDEGALLGIAGVSSDVTERVEREQTLQQQVERLDQFASMVSHDLRNPLAIAHSNLELYRERGEEARLDAVADALGRIETITTDLLTIVRPDEGDLDRSPVSLAAVADAAWSVVDTGDASLTVVEDATLQADESQLRIALENLFRNVVDHGGPDVTVRVGPLDGGFFVEDDGVGMDESMREQAFTHGFTTGGGGTGIGLTIVQRVATAHGWTVTATESADGGARFEFHETESEDEPE